MILTIHRGTGTITLIKQGCCEDGCREAATLVHDSGLPFCLEHATEHDAPETFVDLRNGERLA